MTETRKIVRASALKPGNKVVFKPGRNTPHPLCGEPLRVKTVVREVKERKLFVTFHEQNVVYILPWDRRVTLVEDPSWEVVAVGAPLGEKASTYALPGKPPTPVTEATEPAAKRPCLCVAAEVRRAREPQVPRVERTLPVEAEPYTSREQRDRLLVDLLHLVNNFTRAVQSLIKKVAQID
jgi:hypothetical protein